MSFIKFFQFRTLVGATALGLAITSFDCVASTGSWQSQPAWAASDNTPRKSTFRAPVAGPFAPGSNNIAIDVGQIFLMGGLSERYSDNIGSQIHYSYGVSDLFAFDTSIGYSSHSDGKFSMMTGLAGLRTNLAWYDKVVPYLVFGMGFYKPSYQISGGGTGALANSNSASNSSSTSPLLFGVHLGPGVDLELTRQLFFGAALTFHDIFGSSNVVVNNQTYGVGGTYTSFFLHAGFTF